MGLFVDIIKSVAESYRASIPDGEICEIGELTLRRCPHGDLRRFYSEALAEHGKPVRAWNKTATAWYIDCGTPTPKDLCAGCGKPLDGAEALDLWPHGERVHVEGYDCIIAYGKRWRASVAAALVSHGIPVPVEIAAELSGEADDDHAA